MKRILIIFLLLPVLTYGQNIPEDTVSFEDLEWRDELRYKLNSEIPFTGFKLKSNYSVNGTSEGRYVNGLKDGLWTYWHKNGNKKVIQNYINGKRNGPWIHWHENGWKRVEGQYDRDWLAGVYTEWNEQGDKEVEIELEKEYWLKEDFLFYYDDVMTQFIEFGDGIRGEAIMSCSPCYEIVYSREDNISKVIRVGLIILLLVVLFYGIKFLFLKPKEGQLFYKFSLHKIENRMRLLQLFLWGIIALHIFIILTPCSVKMREHI